MFDRIATNMTEENKASKVFGDNRYPKFDQYDRIKKKPGDCDTITSFPSKEKKNTKESNLMQPRTLGPHQIEHDLRLEE